MAPRAEATGVLLVRLRAVFRSGFRLDPIKSRRSESSLSCMDVSSFQRTWARRSTCCESGRLYAQAWQRRWENSGVSSKTLFRRPVFPRAVDVAPDVGFVPDAPSTSKSATGIGYSSLGVAIFTFLKSIQFLSLPFFFKTGIIFDNDSTYLAGLMKPARTNLSISSCIFRVMFEAILLGAH